MAKKRQRKQQVSKGTTHQNPNRLGNRIRKSMLIDYKGSEAELSNKVAAWRAGKNVILTVSNPDKKNTKERMIRIPATEYWGYPRQMQIKMR
jgi:hypothetical protein